MIEQFCYPILILRLFFKRIKTYNLEDEKSAYSFFHLFFGVTRSDVLGITLRVWVRTKSLLFVDVQIKSAGIIAMGGSILVLLVIPFLNTSEIRNTTYRPIFKIFFWLFMVDFYLLTWVGQKPMKNSYILLGQIATVYYE